MTGKQLYLLVLLWQTIIVAITAFSLSLIPLRTDYLGGATQAYLRDPFLYSRANFDGNHYLSIVLEGYGYSQQAFFPLYPLLIKLFSTSVAEPALVGVGISLGSFVVGLYIFEKLIRLDYSPKTTRWIIYLLLFFPVSFYFSFVYTEGLFFLLCIASFYFFRTGKLFLAGLFGGLAAFTRLIGVAIFPAFILELFLSQKPAKIKSALPLLLIPFGLFLYMAFLENTSHDPLAFIHVQASFGQGRSDHFIFFPQVLWRYLKMIVTVNRADPLYLTILLEFVTAVIFSLTSVLSLYKHRLSYSIFNLICIFLPTLTGNFTSMSRYVIVAFPSFMLLGSYVQRLKKPLKIFTLVTLSGIFCLYLMLFVRGYWVA